MPEIGDGSGFSWSYYCRSDWPISLLIEWEFYPLRDLFLLFRVYINPILYYWRLSVFIVRGLFSETGERSQSTIKGLWFSTMLFVWETWFLERRVDLEPYGNWTYPSFSPIVISNAKISSWWVELFSSSPKLKGGLFSKTPFLFI